MPLIPFARSSKADGDTRGYSGERLLNYFLRVSDGISQGILIGRSGLVPETSLGGRVRAMVDNNGVLFAVAAGAVWKVIGITATKVGDVPDGPAVMAASGPEVAIVVGGGYYICDGTTTTQYATGALTTASSVVYQDGYFVVTGSSAGRDDALTVSALNDGTKFDATDFAFAENAPDEIKGAINDHGELWLFGSKTIEAWYNSGDVDFPFARNNGAQKERGCLNGQTIAKEDNSVFWIGQDRVAYRSGGGNPEVISNREIEEILADAVIDRAYTFKDRGHKFYAIRLSGRPTLCFDLTTGLWSERSTGVEDEEWIATSAENVSGVQYIGTTTGKICALSENVFTDDGAMVRAEAVSVPAEMPYPGRAVNSVEISLNVGTVDASGQIMLQTTKDGRIWGVEKWRSLGSLGSYQKTPRWRGLGRFTPRFQVRVRITDPVNRDIYGVRYE